MPQKTVYIRKEDLPLWEKLENKSLVIHELLNGEEFSVQNANLTKLRRFVVQVVDEVLADRRGY